MIARITVALLAGLLVVGCQRSDDQETGTISDREVREARADLPPAVLAALDSGNTAFRAKDYHAALAAYRSAVQQKDDLSAGWFGIYMAQLALGNTAAADSAMQKAQKLSPGASLIHPGPGSGGLPAGHPTVPDSMR